MPEGPDGSMMSGAAIVALWRRENEDLQHILNYQRNALLEMVQLSSPRWFIGMDLAVQPDVTAVTDVTKPNPHIAAEKLLRSVLPEDLCISLSAIGECDVQGKKHRYKIFKKKKTHCFQGDKVFSCCIELSDSAAPDTDRIVAEYLMIRNDEEKYLETANLTQIGGPRPVPDPMINELRLPPFPGWGRVGTTVNIRRPPRYEVDRHQLAWRQDRAIPPQMILDGIVRRFEGIDRMRGRRWPVLSPYEVHGYPFPRSRHTVMLPRLALMQETSFEEADFRFCHPVAEEIADFIDRTPNIFAFEDVAHTLNSSIRAISGNGLQCCLAEEYDIRVNDRAAAVVLGALLR